MWDKDPLCRIYASLTACPSPRNWSGSFSRGVICQAGRTGIRAARWRRWPGRTGSCAMSRAAAGGDRASADRAGMLLRAPHKGRGPGRRGGAGAVRAADRCDHRLPIRRAVPVQAAHRAGAGRAVRHPIVVWDRRRDHRPCCREARSLPGAGAGGHCRGRGGRVRRDRVPRGRSAALCCPDTKDRASAASSCAGSWKAQSGSTPSTSSATNRSSRTTHASACAAHQVLSYATRPRWKAILPAPDTGLGIPRQHCVTRH